MKIDRGMLGLVGAVAVALCFQAVTVANAQTPSTEPSESAEAVTWRGQSDVDLDWQIDPSGWFTGEQQLLNCYPSN